MDESVRGLARLRPGLFGITNVELAFDEFAFDCLFGLFGMINVELALEFIVLALLESLEPTVLRLDICNAKCGCGR